MTEISELFKEIKCHYDHWEADCPVSEYCVIGTGCEEALKRWFKHEKRKLQERYGSSEDQETT